MQVFLRIFSGFILTVFLLNPFLVFARPLEGFLEGPYLYLAGGFLQFDWDVNQRTQVQEGSAWEPVLGLGFGWNVYDWMAPELFLRYTTTANNGRREHVAGANTGIVFTLLLNPLLDIKKWKILPFLKPGIGVQVVALPGDVLANDNKVSLKGYGPTIGGGVRLTFKDYLYFGLEAQEEFLFHEEQKQTLSTGGVALIYKEGFKNQLVVLGTVGVHF